MYTKESKENQFSFTHDWFVVPELDENHELIKIAKTIDWVSLSDKLAKFYSPDNGRPTKPSRAKIGLLILKHLYRLSDVDVEVLATLKKTKLLKGKKLICDTTIVSSPIAYPTDINLLEKVRLSAIKFLDQAKQFGVKTYRTYKRTAQKFYIQYQKIRHHTTKFRKKTQKRLIQFASRNIRQLQERVNSLGTILEDSLHKTEERFGALLPN